MLRRGLHDLADDNPAVDLSLVRHGRGHDLLPTCGERRLGPRDLRLRTLLHQAFHELTSVDGRLVRSLREITLHPGALTLAYLQGLLCVSSLAAGIDRMVGGPALQSPAFDHTLSVVALLACAL